MRASVRSTTTSDDPNRVIDDLSVDHAHVINHYRSGREIVARHEKGQASTEDLRQAMVHFRALFDELVAGEVFADERTTLKHQWDRGDQISTEDLRIALRKYRSFFDRLLSL